MELFPENPTNSDEILMIVSTSFPFLDCSLDSLVTYFACGAYSFDAFYNTGFESGDCERTDTVNLGTLPNGLYMLSYRMYYLGWAQVDQADTSISIGDPTGIRINSNEENDILNIYPNPSHGSVNIMTKNTSVSRIRISNSSATIIHDLMLDKGQINQVNTISLSPGLYLCTAFSDGYPTATAKIIVLDD